MKNEYYTIGEAIGILQKEFPDIAPFTLRFWQSEGLIQPSCITVGGHRRYSKKDLNVIRFVKRLSMYGYPLRQIKQALDSVKDKYEIKMPIEFPVEYPTKIQLWKVLKQTNDSLNIYKRSALMLGGIIKEIAEKELRKEFKVQLGDYEEGVSCICLIMESKIVSKDYEDWMDKLICFERKINDFLGTCEKEGLYIKIRGG